MELRQTTFENKTWYNLRDVFKELGLAFATGTNIRKRNINPDYIKRLPFKVNNQTQHCYFITIEAIEMIVKNSNKIKKENILKFQNYLGLKTTVYNIRPEVHILEILDAIINVNNVSIKREFQIGNRRVDGFIPEFNLFIEVQEKYYHDQTYQKIDDVNKLEEIKKEVVNFKSVFPARMMYIYTGDTDVEIIKQFMRILYNLNNPSFTQKNLFTLQ